jgi:hypothetical protein
VVKFHMVHRAGCECRSTPSSETARSWLAITTTLCITLALPCARVAAKTHWAGPAIPASTPSSGVVEIFSPPRCSDSDDSAESAANSFAAANRLHQERNARCIDVYYHAALTAWECLDRFTAGQTERARAELAWDLYHESLAALIELGQRYGRLDPRRGLVVYTQSGHELVPITRHGFAWQADDFHRLLVVGNYRSNDFSHFYKQTGVGVSLVALRHAPQEELFLGDTRPFAATVVLRTLRANLPEKIAVDGASAASPTAALEIYNPLSIREIDSCDGPLPLRRDHTASLAFLLSKNPRTYLAGFLQPGTSRVRARLTLLEPYQPGKVPVVFIHGLFSDPMTWMDMGNELLAESDLYQRYQIWVFRYPTGSGFFEQAAELRRQLDMARELFDPSHADAALSQMVLIGHSMGGLVAKLQVTESSDTLWRRAARVPLEAVHATPKVRGQLQRTLFFEPLSFVTRVVFIGTPHSGSGAAMRLSGRLASSLVQVSEERNRDWDELMRQNPGAFDPGLQGRPPTSVDLLKPSNPFLGAMRELCFGSHARFHSIIGTAGWTIAEGRCDGIVPVASAQHPGAESEVYIEARHARLHRDQATVAEVKRILRLHAATLGEGRRVPCLRDAEGP